MRSAMVMGAAAMLLAAGCAGGAATPEVMASDAWTRTTDGAQEKTMTAVFVSFANPSSEERVLVEADCGDVAKKTELHVMEMKDGEMIMVQAKDGIPIPAEGHEHLAPGGPHIMLMGLNRELPVGSEEITCQLKLDNGQEMEIVAPVKEFTEEQETYHTHG